MPERAAGAADADWASSEEADPGGIGCAAVRGRVGQTSSAESSRKRNRMGFKTAIKLAWAS